MWYRLISQSAQKHPSSRILTAATRLFSVMKVTHSRGSVSELKLVTLQSHMKGQGGHTTHTHTHSALPRPRLRAVLASFCDRHSGVMGRPGQAVTRLREAHTVDPPTASTCSLTSCRPSRLKQHFPKGHLATPRGGTRLLFHLLNVG